MMQWTEGADRILLHFSSTLSTFFDCIHASQAEGLREMFESFLCVIQRLYGADAECVHFQPFAFALTLAS